MNWEAESSPPVQPVIANVEAEAALLGALMIDNRLIDQLAGVVDVDDFSEQLHGRIFKAIRHLRATDTAATPVTLKPYFMNEPAIPWKDEQGRTQHFEIGGYLATLTGSGAAIIGARDFATQVRDLAIARAVVAATEDAHEIMSDWESESTISARASDLAAKIVGAAERANPVKIETASTLLGAVRHRQARLREGASIGAMISCLPEINDLIGALAPKQMTIIGGRPSMGKSVLAQSIAWGCAKNGHPTLLISQEMSRDALAMRLAADITHAMNEPVDYGHILKGTLDESELAIIDEAEKRVAEIPLSLVSPDRATIEEIEALVALHTAALARKGQALEVLIVDYIQIIGSTKKFGSRIEEINYISGRLLKLAKRYNMHVIVLSQLNRDVEKRPDKRPQLADLKESGRLEEDADNVMFAYRAEYYLEREKPEQGDKKFDAWEKEWQDSRGKLDAIAAKVRAGKIGTRRLTFIGSSQAVRSKDWSPDFMGEARAMI